eukprot:5980253-Pleurochrysis_carterae.AAC.1
MKANGCNRGCRLVCESLVYVYWAYLYFERMSRFGPWQRGRSLCLKKRRGGSCTCGTGVWLNFPARPRNAMISRAISATTRVSREPSSA